VKILSDSLAYLQYLCLRLAGALYALVPPEKAYNLGASVLTLFYPLLKKRRRLAIENIIKAGITDDLKEADRIAKASLGHLGGHICEAFKIGRVINRDNWRDHVEIDVDPQTQHLLFEQLDQPIIMLTGHIGVWEAGISILSLERPMMAVARKMNNRFAERFMQTQHFRGNITLIDKNRGFTPSVVRTWKQNAAIMAIAMDQHAGRKTGMRVKFMGREAGTHTSPARLHLSSGAPVLIGALIRSAPFKYKLIGGKPINYTPTGNRDNDLKMLLELFNQRLEMIVRSYPEQYLWAHNRWRKEKHLAT